MKLGISCMTRGGARVTGVGLLASIVLALAPAAAFGATADLAIDKSDSADPVVAGSEIVYTLTISNAGPDTANAVTVEDKLPSDLELIAASASQGACATKGKTVTCELGALANGASATATIRARPKRDGQISNTASVSTADTDPTAADNTDTEATTVLAPPDQPSCAGKAATIVGTAGPDRLVGTTKADVILALGGNDVIEGLGGDDIVCSAGGDDLIKGRSGNDTIRGGTGSDRIRGGGGGDELRGGGGFDRLLGGAGPDALFGGGGADTCRGGSGADTKRHC